MNYKLAKQLKEAGFPYKEEKVHYNGLIIPPTLEELIDACGDKFGELRQYKSKPKWMVKSKDKRIIEHAETLKIAVASLWLKLNEKIQSQRRKIY